MMEYKSGLSWVKLNGISALDVVIKTDLIILSGVACEAHVSSCDNPDEKTK